MKNYLNNFRFFLGRLKETMPRFYRRYYAVHISRILMLLVAQGLGVWLPAFVVSAVMNHRSFGLILIPIVVFALAQIALSQLNTDFRTLDTFVRSNEIPGGPLCMMTFPAEEMQGTFGRQIFQKIEKAVFRGNDFGLEDYFRQSWVFVSYLLLSIVFLAVSARLSLGWMLLILIPSLIKEWLKTGYYKLQDSSDDEQLEIFFKKRYYERVALQNETAKDVRLYHMTDVFEADQEETNKRHLTIENKLARRKQWYDQFGFILFLARDIVSVLILIRALKNGMAVDQFVLYLSILPAVGISLAKCFEAFVRIKCNHKTVTEYREVLSLPKYDEGDYSATMPEGVAEIVFENVSYSYDDNPVFKDLNLTIHPGEKLALVGANGAGKTTLAKLAAGIYTPDSGRILYNGIDLRDVNPKDRYRYATIVFQDVFMLAATLAENLAAEPPEAIDRDRALRALEQAGLKDFVETLPNGLDTHMTKYVNDDGTEFSGGQQQRLVLARALYKGGNLLILDEPTSALDPLAEAALYREYLTFTQGKTSVFISHRLSSTQFCDRIVFLADGVIKETGTHEELMAEKGLYYDMFKTQAKYYQDRIEGEEA